MAHFRPEDKTIVFISGDSDILPAVGKALEKNWKVEVYMWEHARSSKLKKHNGILVEHLDRMKNKILFNSLKFPIANNHGLLVENAS